ncbi:DUF2975 domain-containing protein [Streptomyces sp. NPDC059874]|uniref:DUF2975 domain-containing protein n=1 Tax=Streptomyces sp. NPDC059874 TaxID=3346983 RepID=UPI003666270D
MPQEPKLIGPLASTVEGTLRVLAGLTVVTFVLSLFTDVRMGWGGDGCVTATWMNGRSADTTALFPTLDGSQVSAIPQYCAVSASAYQRTLSTLGELPWMLMLVGGLLLLNMLLRTAGRDGVYTRDSATRMRRLGWWLIVGSVTAEVAQANAQAALLATLTREAPYSAFSWFDLWTAPYLAVFIGLSLLVFSSVIRNGSDMREDIEATI